MIPVYQIIIIIIIDDFYIFIKFLEYLFIIINNTFL